jgi:exodeoxyribonuclease-1
MDYHTGYAYPFIPEMDPDAALYQDGFFSAGEKREARGFHTAMKALVSDHDSRNMMVHDILNQIQSPRVRTLAGRILARNFSAGNSGVGKRGAINLQAQTGQLNDTEYQLHLNRLRSCREEDAIIGYKNDIKLNQKNGLDELKAVEQEMKHPSPDQIKMLAWIKTYIENL